MKAAAIVPGLSDYPEIERRCQRELDMLGAGCASCAKSAALRKCRQWLDQTRERDKRTRIK